MLDACLLFGDAKYWDAFVNVYEFVFEKFIAMDAGGEWYERLDRGGNVLDGALAHSWKISYHTVRSMIQTEWRLRKLIEQGVAAEVIDRFLSFMSSRGADYEPRSIRLRVSL